MALDWQYHFSGREELVDKVIAFFTAKATNPGLFDDIVAKCEETTRSIEDPGRDTLLKLGFLSLSDFAHYEVDSHQRGNQEVLPAALVQRLLDALCAHGILFQEPFLQAGRHYPLYSVNDGLARFLHERWLIKSTIFGFGYIARNYRNAIVKVLVRTREGDDGVGTGFLHNLQNHQRTKQWSIVFTNKHVAEHEKHLQVLSVDNDVKKWHRVFVSDRHDIAAILLQDFWETPSLHLYPDAKVLDDVMIAGYPPVPTARDAYQLVHRGEINSFMTDYWNNEFFLFSAKTSPGNSGGPVINDMGMVVGVVTQQLFEKGAFESKGQLPYFAAVPATSVIDFMNENVVGKLE